VRLTDEPQFVVIPNFYLLDKSKIQYLDILIYTALKSFDNASKGCFPMHETIANLAGMSKRFVIGSIKRLEAAGLITVQRSLKKKNKNHYHFNKLERFEQIPYDVFEASSLTPNEKAMLICLRQFFIHGVLTCVDDVPFFARWLGLSYNTVKPMYNSLVDKGYIKEEFRFYRNQCSYTYKRLTDKLSWRKMSCITSIYRTLNKPEQPMLKIG
jgi:DNA-binding MarR family transcriptional regulator